MGMLGNQLAPGTQFAVTNDSYNGDGSTTAFTLSQSVSATTDIEVIVDNVQQSPHDGSYSVSGTALTFSEAPATGTNNIYVIYHGSKHHTTAQVIPDAGSVDHSKMHTNATLPITRDMTNNRVGINHTSPEQHLHISSSTNTRALIETTNAGSVAELQLKNTAETVKLGIETSSDAGGGAYGNAGASEFVIQYGTNAGVVVDTSGRTRHPNQPGFLVREQPSVGAGNYIVGGNVNHNIGNHFNGATGTFTAPVSGRYHFVAAVLTSSNANNRLEMFIHVNGGTLLAGNESCGNNQHGSAVISAPINLTANDSVRFWLSSGGMHNGHSNNYFGCHLIG